MGIDTIIGDVQDSLDVLEEILEQNPAVLALVATAFKKLQDLIKDAQLPEKHEKPVTADDIRKAVQGAVSNLKESQSSLEQFIELSLDSSSQLVAFIATLIGIPE